MSNNFTYVIAGGRITCNQCQAMSKRSRQRCKAPAMRGFAVCRTHGALSRGATTEAGKLRARTANLKHGRETRQVRTERSLGSARLAVLEAVGQKLGFMNGPRNRGRKPNQMSRVYPELRFIFMS